jgi:hypothetical protein
VREIEPRTGIRSSRDIVAGSDCFRRIGRQRAVPRSRATSIIQTYLPFW